MINYNRKLRSLLLSAASMIVALALFAGCGDTLKNDIRTNLPPTVEFVNVPPENQSFSQNPEINWIGKDVDGQVVLFRFAVITENDIITALGGGQTSPLSNGEVRTFVDGPLTNMNDTVWTTLVVDQQGGDPQTSNIIPMAAELSDPVDIFVAQFVFIQAFDEEGLASIIAFRRFLRNDNPPNTFIRAFDEKKDFINAIVSTSFATGVRIRWEGVDPIDFPSDPPPFEFHWRLYGPYMSDTNTFQQGYLEDLIQNHVKPVFVTSNAKVLEFGLGLSFFVCREIVDQVNGGLIEICDTVFVDTIQSSGPLGTIDTLFDVEDTSFANSSLNRIVAESFDGIDEWTFDRRDSLFNLFREEQSDQTITRHFIFWVRSRDDAKVPDLTPAFIPFRVVDPKFERDLLVVNSMTAFSVNGVLTDSIRAYWRSAIGNFGLTDYQDSLVVPTDTAVDYLTISGPSGNVLPLESMLAHKAVIIFGDDTKVGLLAPVFSKIGTAVNAGVNMWLATRNPITGGEGAPPELPVLAPLPIEYLVFFGVQQANYSGWDWHIRVNFPATRIEDFVGTFTLNENEWPNLTIDTARLRTNYKWSTIPLTYVDTLGPNKDQSALPEVNWMVRIPGTEPMYLYKSLYGSSHPLGNKFSFDGHPVMIRFNTGLFRTVHSLFTPIAFEQDSMQVLINSILDWLLEGKLNSSSPGSVYYDDAPNPAAAQAALKEYWRMREAEDELLPPITYGIGRD